MKGSGGLFHGLKDELDLAVLRERSIRSFVQLSSVVCHTLSSGLLNTLHWMENRFAGGEKPVLLDGMLTSCFGKWPLEQTNMHWKIINFCLCLL